MRIFWDVDTQNDFMNENGALYVPEAELIKPNLKELTDYAKELEIPILGSVDRHFGTEGYKDREEELQRNGGPFPDHCMNGTFGKGKIFETVLKQSTGQGGGFEIATYIENPLIRDVTLEQVKKEMHPRFLEFVEKNYVYQTTGISMEVIEGLIDAIHNNLSEGIYFEKQTYDIFTNPMLKKFLEKAGINEAVVYGVATDYCVKAAVLGMQERGIQTYVVGDAIKGVDVNPGDSAKALEEMAEAGAQLVTTKQVLEGKI